MAADKDLQLERLNTRLRENGRSPERDLWQGIDAAITVEEKKLKQRPAHLQPTPWRPRVLWMVAALLAFAMVLIPLGFQTGGNNMVPPIENHLMEGSLVSNDSESTLALAIVSLETAARENPGYQNLSRLMRMVHSRQGELLRHKWSENNRVQGYLNGGVS